MLISSSLIFFYTRASLWIMQCVQITSGDFFLTNAWSCLISCLTDIDCAPSVQSPMQFVRFMSFSSKKVSIILKISLDEAFPGMGLQNNISSIIFVSATYRTYAIKWASLATSVTSSTCKAILEVRSRETNWSQRSSDTSLILHHLTQLFRIWFTEHYFNHINCCWKN